MTVTRGSAVALLLDAADRIARAGWCRLRLADSHGAVCTVGALAGPLADDDGRWAWWEASAVDPPWCYQVALRAIAATLGWDPERCWRDTEAALFVWNDAEGRTAAEVRRILVRAAALAADRHPILGLSPVRVADRLPLEGDQLTGTAG